jgi:hypothetical protein
MGGICELTRGAFVWGYPHSRSPFDFAQGRLAAAPDFLWNLVALANFMRLSLRKGASSAAWQEIRVRRDDKFRSCAPQAGLLLMNVERSCFGN